MIQDAAIIGNGPAGLSAALYLLRAGFSVTVIGQDNGALEKAGYIENYFGLGTPKTGHQLVEDGKAQVLRLGGQLLRDQVVGITWDGDFLVDTAGSQLTSRTILLTTGTSRKMAPIDQLDRLEGRGVSYCAVCDAFFFRGKKVAVIGSGAYAAGEYEELKNVVDDVTILTDGKEPQFSLPCDRRKIDRFEGGDFLEKVVFADGTSERFDGVFIACGSAGAFELSKKLGLETANNKIVTDEKCATNIPGVYAAGDCVAGLQQIAKAVCDGMVAGTEALRYLKSL